MYVDAQETYNASVFDIKDKMAEVVDVDEAVQSFQSALSS